MSAKRLSVMILVTLCLGTGFAQKRPQPTTNITVGNQAVNEHAQFNTIQAAINAAKPGDIIEILDERVYAEQITIDGRDKSPWPNVTGGKNGITLLYVPNPATPLSKPIIRYRDITNQFPKTNADARKSDELSGSGNFETCGALRVLWAQEVTIDGIEIDAVSAQPFGYNNVWCDQNGQNCSPLFHGNAAVALAVSGSVTIRNCFIRNGYFGISVKDRNTGGVFGNPNPADNDITVPLSGFGSVGNHIFEHNRINNNSVGVYFESAWDLGSTVRYNLIYNNAHTSAVYSKSANSGLLTSLPETANNNAGAFLFKDMYLTPLAIYNNTLHNNSGNFQGHWQIGGQHLIFNNILSRSNPDNNPSAYMTIDGRFPNRMHNNTFSATERVDVQCQPDRNCTQNAATAPGGCWVTNVQMREMAGPTATNVNLTNCNNTSQTIQTNLVRPGSVISGLRNGSQPGELPIPAGANIKWLQVDGYGSNLPHLFKSMTETSPDFLVPDWDNQQVKDHILNMGWQSVGIRNSDGKQADLGAIPSTGVQQRTLARIRPLTVVMLNGNTATAIVRLDQYQGTILEPRVSFLRWIAPVPQNNCGETWNAAEKPHCTAKNDWVNSFQMIPANAITTIPNPAGVRQYGRNEFSFTIPANTTNSPYGFFEIALTGKDEATGNDVTTDVAFLPYRQLEYIMNITVHPTGVTPTDANRLTEVIAGQTYQLRVRPTHRSGTAFTNILNEVTYELTSGPTAQMLCKSANCPTAAPVNADNDKLLTADVNIQVGGKIYEVIFTKAGEETIRSAGLYTSGSQRLSFLGIETINVRPGDPAKVAWIKPIPKSQLPAGTQPEVIYRGGDFEATVQVQDRYGNAVDRQVWVSIVSDDAAIGDAGAPGNIATKRVQCDASTGIATFAARVTNGTPGQIFNMTATLESNNATDVGALRVSRVNDFLQPFYSDVGSGKAWRDYYDPDIGISATAGDWVQVTVKAVSTDTVMTSKGGCVQVEFDNDGIVASATSGGASANSFTMTAGVATFWISTAPGLTASITDASINVNLHLTCGGAADNGVRSGSRPDISFRVPSTDVRNAVIFGDGHGRPDSVYLVYAMGGSSFIGQNAVAFPDSVMVKWPTAADPGVIVRRAAAGSVAAVNDSTLKVILGAAGTAQFPTGYTNTANNGRGLVTVYGGSKGSSVVDGEFDVLDGTGIIIAGYSGDMIPGRVNPIIVENLSPPGARTPDTLIVQFSEQFNDDPNAPMPLEGLNTFLYTTDPNPLVYPATGGTVINVAHAQFDANGYKLALAPNSPVPAEGNWLRLNPASPVLDRFGNRVHIANRWVQITERPTPPGIRSGYYTSADNTGNLNYAYITFNKPVNLMWFSGATFSFSTGANDKITIPADPTGLLATVSGDPNTIRVSLSEVAGYKNVIKTSGDIRVSISFSTANQDVSGWDAIDPYPLEDRARPVLADTVRLKVGAMGENEGDPDAPDTLVLVFSEEIPPNQLQAVAFPVIIALSTSTAIPQLGEPQISTVTIKGNAYSQVTYIIDPGYRFATFPSSGDRVYINPAANILDNMIPPNIQDQPDNVRQPLKIERGPLRWKLGMSNNPFRSGSQTKVDLKPGAKGATVQIDATIRLYNNMGNVVLTQEMKDVQDSIQFLWNGHNDKGRMVGTGTYLMRIRCNARVLKDDGGVEMWAQPYTVQRPIGFVRGKK
ncbi:MAG: right-handed parallel beta-helix repeat-containing protein [Chitinispirillia bacterium]|nr:right-handed parallel beta-helix repeat-containing protein [Chitinispirillia bacterium]MCL2241193.1 right-handed parallel beta-helix repeat-containing protein [Chitinispirillia bacterium]